MIAVKRQQGSRSRQGAPAGLKTDRAPSAVVHSSVYFPTPVYEVLRKVAFDERTKIHDLVMEGIDTILQRRGYPSIERLKSSRKR
jgi:hypothetical protein